MECKIITVGLSPCWDRTIEIDGINWGQHKIISSQKISPAGKALNINKALSWLGVESIAAGLWGSDDFQQMQQAVKKLKKINIQFTKVPGSTRENITIVDTKNKRQIHLRSKSTLANEKSLKLLKKDLQKIIINKSFCIFAGAMPNNAIELIELAKKKGASVVIDTSGPALKKIVAKGGLFLIKPNLEELGELVGRKIKNENDAIISAAKKLLTKVKFILVSRAEKGAILVFSRRRTGDASLRGRKAVAISARYTGKKYDVYNTVACGDFLLAGFLSVLVEDPENLEFYFLDSKIKGGTESPRIFRIFAPRKQKSEGVAQYNKQICVSALETGLKAATAKAFSLTETLFWSQINSKLKVRCSMLNVNR